MWELVLSLHVLRGRATWPEHRSWWDQARQRIRDLGLLPRLPLLSTLVPAKGDFPDFLTPTERVNDLDQGLDAILAMSRTQLRDDLAAAYTRRAAPSWIRPLADGDRTVLTNLVAALRDYFNAVIRPHWGTIHEQVAADRLLLTHSLTTGGVDQLLNALPAPITWRWPVLETPYPEDRTIMLNGRGLILIPSYFCFGNPMTYINPELPPVLVYPARQHRAGPVGQFPQSGPPKRLAALLGHTRAQALLALRTPCSTSDLADRIDMSVASASQHTTVLREAGLATSTRIGKIVLHSLTPLGQELLGSPAPTSALN